MFLYTKPVSFLHVIMTDSPDTFNTAVLGFSKVVTDEGYTVDAPALCNADSPIVAANVKSDLLYYATINYTDISRPFLTFKDVIFAMLSRAEMANTVIDYR